MIAMVVLLLALLAMLSVVPFGYSSVETNSIQVQAVAIGQKYLDDERNAKLHSTVEPTATTIPIDAGQSYIDGSKAETNYGNFTVTPDGCTTVEDTGSPASGVDVWLCSVSVTWTENSAPKSVTVQGYVTF